MWTVQKQVTNMSHSPWKGGGPCAASRTESGDESWLHQEVVLKLQGHNSGSEQCFTVLHCFILDFLVELMLSCR